MKLLKNEDCWCNSGLKYEECHNITDKKLAFYKASGYETPEICLLKNSDQIEGIRESCRINIEVLDYISDYVLQDMTTNEIDQLIYRKTIELDGIPATLNYNNYPKSCCISINDVVCHGIPSSKLALKDGDIVNIDVSTIYNGFYSDSSRMFSVGNVSVEKQRFVEIARECMIKGIEKVKPWGFMGDIGYEVNQHARRNAFSVVREFGGHGVGLEFHENPFIGYVSSPGTGMILVPGMIFTIEPMINMGKASIFIDKKDKWTVYTTDGLPSAQWENTVLVTNQGYEILAY